MKKTMDIPKQEKKETPREPFPGMHAKKDPSAAMPRGSFNASKRAKILILDDHPIIRRGIAEFINSQADMTVCGEAEDYPKALTMMAAEKPDLVIVDISLNGSSGIEFLKVLKVDHPEVPALVLSMHDELLYAERVLREGARGYVTKQEAVEKIAIAIRKILEGQIYLSDRMMEHILEKKYMGQANLTPMESLSDRELEVFRLIGEGATTVAIAQQLHRSVKTIETYRARIKVKFNLKNNMELIRMAMHWVQNE
ncbi:MAG: response regulator transcription factor [Candidatus Omnitrophota bacterium]